jgi:hypothetical protein
LVVRHRNFFFSRMVRGGHGLFEAIPVTGEIEENSKKISTK